jgi:phosphopantetheinyl transferase (holo-ACP synthase)
MVLCSQRARRHYFEGKQIAKMALGVGIEVLYEKNIRDSLEGSGEHFLKKSLTDWEVSRAKKDPLPLVYYSRIFSAKEAILRLFEEEPGVLPTEIEIRDGRFGEPVPRLTGKIKRIMKHRGASRISLNVIFEDGFAVAVAVLE